MALPLQLFAQTARVPFVGCELGGQVRSEAPVGKDEVVRMPPQIAQRLAYYKESFRGTGILAPRGWHCTGFIGSGGSNMLITPEPFTLADLVTEGITGSFIELESVSGETGSGLHDMAEILARVFPMQKAFVRDVSQEKEVTFQYGPFPNDQIITQTDQVVRYRTPAYEKGLGTLTREKATGDPIDGVAVFHPAKLNPGLRMLRVRLPRQMQNLTPAIIRDLLVRESSDTR
jgi:hypothetical protein